MRQTQRALISPETALEICKFEHTFKVAHVCSGEAGEGSNYL